MNLHSSHHRRHRSHHFHNLELFCITMNTTLTNYKTIKLICVVLNCRMFHYGFKYTEQPLEINKSFLSDLEYDYISVTIYLNLPIEL